MITIDFRGQSDDSKLGKLTTHYDYRNGGTEKRRVDGTSLSVYQLIDSVMSLFLTGTSAPRFGTPAHVQIYTDRRKRRNCSRLAFSHKCTMHRPGYAEHCGANLVKRTCLVANFVLSFSHRCGEW